MLTKTERDRLLSAAIAARKNAYAPYSGFHVGAALLCEDGRIFCGCNVENSAYSPTLCAERVAIGAAVAAGARCFRAIAVVGGSLEAVAACPPCGVCRQVLSEFTDGSLTVIFYGEDGIVECPLADLLPHSFSIK